MNRLRVELGERASREQAVRTSEFPSTDIVVAAAGERSSLLWSRMPEHSSFLSIRLGTGALRSRTTVKEPVRSLDAAEEWEELTGVIDSFRSVENVPVIASLATAGAMGFTGSDGYAQAALRAAVLQLAVLHSPADVAFCAFVGDDSRSDWTWVKWLPHVDSPHSPLAAPLAADWGSGSTLLTHLEALLSERSEAAGRKTVRSHLPADDTGQPNGWRAVDALPVTPAVVVLVIGEPMVDRGRLVALAERGPDVGIFVLWFSPEPARLPVVCRTFVNVSGASAVANFVRHGDAVPLSSTDFVDVAVAQRVARELSPLEDDGAPVLDESDLPRVVRLQDLFEDDILDDDEAVVARWVASDSLVGRWRGRRHSRGLDATVGQGAAEPFRLDLRADGPHALVAGSTGGGKSEALQTWLLSMALSHSPDRLTFLLVDFKGGSAFADCVNLPHTAGMVTDLTPHLVQRALASLRAELTYREELLAHKGAKDLVTLEELGDPDTPPSLVIVVDEFAALASEEPEFVDGVVDIAQRGRSLGLHLIMATQRPAGVIKDNLRANTNLRIALRVTDEADSSDVLGTKAAAHFPTDIPGRAGVRRGGSRVTTFQTAFVGARTGEVQRARTPDIDIVDLPFGTGAVWPNPTRASAPAEGLTDIARSVRTIRAASRSERLREPRRPWLDELPAVINQDELPRTPGVLALGVVDDPARQAQYPFTLDTESVGSTAIFGAGAAGKSTVLRSIAYAAGLPDAEPAWVYALDCTGGGLSALEALPVVGSVVLGSDTERVTRLMRQLTAAIDERGAQFAARNTSNLSEYNADAVEPLPRILLLLDGMSAFRAEYEFDYRAGVFDALARILSDGRQVGIHVILTADRASAVPQSMMSVIQSRIILRMANSTDYDVLDADRAALEDALPGRAFVGGAEVHIALPGGRVDAAAQAELFTSVAAEYRAPQVQRLSSDIPRRSLPATVDGMPVIGVADDSLEPVGIPPGLFVISGPFGSGRSTALSTVVSSVRATFPERAMYLLAPRPSVLAESPIWKEVAADTDAAATLATTLAQQLTSGEVGPDDVCIVIEAAPDFEATPAEAAIAQLLKTSRRVRSDVIVEADTVTVAAAWQIYNELKSARAGIVLQPEEADGQALFRVSFPRATRAQFPVGRGLMVTSGRVRTVQVAR